MGWNNHPGFSCRPNEVLIKGIADAIATNGMKEAGYQYVNLDDGWQGYRDTNGILVADTNTFPSGIKALADYVHSKGLKFGIYSTRGTNTCCGRHVGSGWNEVTDANTFAAWGVDYLKYDNPCGLNVGDMQTQYDAMRDAILNCGRPIVYAICAMYHSWVPDCANLWRTTRDINDVFTNMLWNLDQNSVFAILAGPGSWSDPDLLQVGIGGMSDAEYQAQFSLWCIAGAPLLVGNDLRNMSQTTKDILTNPEVIAIDQDLAGVQGTCVASKPGLGGNLEVWCKPLGTNWTTKAVALFNRSETNADISVTWSDILLQAGSATVRDLWTRSDLGTFTNAYSTVVPAHGAKLLKIVGTGIADPGFLPPPLGTNYVSDLNWIFFANGWGSPEKDMSCGDWASGDGHPIKLHGVTYAKGLGIHAFSTIEYYLGGVAARFQSDIGIDNECYTCSSVVFQLWADGTKIYDSGVVTLATETKTVDVDISGKYQLTLLVNDAGDGDCCDHADWAGARIIVMSEPFLAWQIRYFGSTGNPDAAASVDPDGDGMSNFQEYLAGTDPTNCTSAFRILGVVATNNDVLVTWATAGGRTNVLQSITGLGGSYTNVSPDIILPGSGDTTTNYPDTGAATNAANRFYRVRLVP
jgi:alpha-galactosidase